MVPQRMKSTHIMFQFHIKYSFKAAIELNQLN